MPVRYRVDDNPPFPLEDWDLSESKYGASHRHDSEPRLLGEMLSGDSLRIRVDVHLDDTARDHSFSLDGFSRAFARLPCYSMMGTGGSH